MFFILFEEI